tara:strand:+ start:48 stop:548 length:501 start_codon:yes stop_codon:yes gene_type:complete
MGYKMRGFSGFSKFKKDMFKAAVKGALAGGIKNPNPGMPKDKIGDGSVKSNFVNQVVNKGGASTQNKKKSTTLENLTATKKSPAKSDAAKNLLKAVPNAESYNKLSDEDKKGFDKAGKKAGLPTKNSPAKKRGLWDNIHAKRKRGGKMRKKGAKGAPTEKAIRDSQ